MTYKFILTLNSIFLNALVCNGQSYGKNLHSDILHAGYNIFNNVENKSYVFEQIDFLQDTITSNYPFLSSTQFNFNYSLLLFGVRRSTLAACLDVSGSRMTTVNQRTCRRFSMKHLPAIKNFISHINSINNYLFKIDSHYQDLKEDIHLTDSNGLIYRELYASDNLYKFIVEICSEASTCLFNEIAGNGFWQINGKCPISTTCLVSGLIYHAYLIIALHFLKGYVTEIYHYDNSLSLSRKAMKIELVQDKFIMHTHFIGMKALSAITIAPRGVTASEPSVEDTPIDSPYIQLKWFVDQIIVNEANLNFDGTCELECADYEYPTVFYNHGSVPHEGKALCNGPMSQCYFQPLGYLCLTDDDSRRYAGVNRGEPSLGQADCRNNTEIHTDHLYYVKSAYPHGCDVCTCLCDDYNNPQTIRTFSLREVTSDIEENMVITGLRLREINGTIYIQIQQGKLVNLTLVESVQWVPVKSFDKTSDSVSPNDYWTLYYGVRNTVNLDTLSTQDEFVRQHIEKNDPDYHIYPIRSYLVTGVKFRGTLDGRLHFGIRLTAWNSIKRKLVVKEWDNWIFNEESPTIRKEIDMCRPDIPIKTQDNVEYESNAYVRFRASDNVKDFGQTTVPFLDAQDVVTQPPMPLSGAGLFYKGKPGYGDFIGLKLISIDFSQLILPILRND